MEFKFEIGCEVFPYNHLYYEVEVKADHVIWWHVRGQGENGHQGSVLESGFTRHRKVDEDPKGALQMSHEQARAWINNYVEIHLELQEGVKACRKEYGEVAE